MQTELLSVSPTGIALYRLSNARGMRVCVINYGARLFSLTVCAADGTPTDVLAGFRTPDEFRGDNPYFNAVIGRVANRIDHGKFTLNGTTYQLALNYGAHHLHGGLEGFDRKMWQVLDASDGAITMRYVSSDGEEHYPGTLTVTVTYRLSEDNALSLDYQAVTDRDTPVSLTNHTYFNLEGDFRSVLDHEAWIDADSVLPTDDDLIPHGDILDVAGTMYDFRTPRPIGSALTPVVPHVVGKGGYDIGYVLRAHDPNAPVATVRAPHSGIRLTVYTDRPCLQFYTGNFLDGLVGKHVYAYQSAFCVETQDYSNALNVPAFPSVILKPGETYRAHTVYAFDVC